MAVRGGKVEICGVNTSALKVLTSKEKEELLIKAGKGDKKAREELIARKSQACFKRYQAVQLKRRKSR